MLRTSRLCSSEHRWGIADDLLWHEEVLQGCIAILILKAIVTAAHSNQYCNDNYCVYVCHTRSSAQPYLSQKQMA